MQFVIKVIVLMFVLVSCDVFADDHVHVDEKGDVFSLVQFQEHLFEPYEHRHEHVGGGRYVHHFNLEPAYLDRELLVTYNQIRLDDEQELELEFELEWALTERIGIVIEGPLAQVNPDVGETHGGFGDVAIGGRLLLYAGRAMLLSMNLELTLPAGDASRDLGDDEYKVSPSLGTWHDLGGGFTLSTHFGSEHGMESDVIEVFYRAGLAYTFGLGHDMLHEHEDEHGHGMEGSASVMLEYTGSSLLSGPEEELSVHTLLLGMSYFVSDTMAVRVGYETPLGKPREFDRVWKVGLMFHF